jgi:hypothetical protein
VYAVPGLYTGALSQITVIPWFWSGGRGAYRVYHGVDRPFPYRPPLPMKSLHIYREFGIYLINVVSTESVLVVDALILTLALSTSRPAHHLLCRRSLRFASILVGLATYPRRRSITFIIYLDFHSEHQSLCSSACGML